MFKVAVSETYITPVAVDIVGDNNKSKTHVFKARFKRLKQSELESLSERLAAKELTDSALIDEVMVGWQDVADAEGNPLEFNPDNLEALLEIYPTRPTIVRTFFDSHNGAKRKN
jgi:hypothetical protein